MNEWPDQRDVEEVRRAVDAWLSKLSETAKAALSSHDRRELRSLVAYQRKQAREERR